MSFVFWNLGRLKKSQTHLTHEGPKRFARISKIMARISKIMAHISKIMARITKIMARQTRNVYPLTHFSHKNNALTNYAQNWVSFWSLSSCVVIKCQCSCVVIKCQCSCVVIKCQCQIMAPQHNRSTAHLLRLASRQAFLILMNFCRFCNKL